MARRSAAAPCQTGPGRAHLGCGTSYVSTMLVAALGSPLRCPRFQHATRPRVASDPAVRSLSRSSRTGIPGDAAVHDCLRQELGLAYADRSAVLVNRNLLV